MRWWLKRTKRPELHQRYDKQSEPKTTRNLFRNRVNLYWYTKEQAITNEKYIFQAKRTQHITRDENWRVCNKCKTYKPRDEFAKNVKWFHQKCGSCKKCKNQEHREYRLNWWYEKDREYKIKRRKLNIGDQIYFNWQIREVIWYKYNRWYTVKSIMSDEIRRIDTNDNKLKTTTNCVKFTKIENPIVMIRSKEKPQFKVKPNWEIYELTAPEKEFSISLDPDEDDEEYYY